MKEKILVVDDEESICVSIKRSLKKKGFRVETVFSGEKAIEQLERVRDYHLVVTDLMMGEKSGVDVFKKAQETNVNIPVLVITGYKSSPLFNRAMELGPCGYLFKPCSNDDLYKRVLKCLGIGFEVTG